MVKMEELIRLILHGFDIYKNYAKSEQDAYALIRRTNEEPGNNQYIFTGSFAEGYPDVVRSDIDIMLLLNADEVLTTAWQEKTFIHTRDAPAHLKVVIPETSVPLFAKSFPYLSTFYSLIQKENGESYLSAVKARQLNQNDFLPEGLKIQKPSAPWHSDSNETTSPSYCLQSRSEKLVTCDRVVAIKCEGWPKISKEWATRTPRNWPARDLVDKVYSSGFALVGKPASASGDVSREWRLSFSIAEMTLIRNFNDCQSKVYYLIRSIYVQYLKEKVSGILSSYNLKTIMFWILEEKPSTYWSTEGIPKIILDIFQKLNSSLKSRFCPHYFLPAHNLLYKVADTDILRAAREVDVILTNTEDILVDISNNGYLGLLPRFGLLIVQTKTLLTNELLKLPSIEAHLLLTSGSEEGIQQSKNIETKCLHRVLNDVATELKRTPDLQLYLDVYLPLTAHGFHLAMAIKQDQAKISIDKAVLSRIHESFLHADVQDMNSCILFWIKVLSVALKDIIAGKKHVLIQHFQRMTSLCDEIDASAPEVKIFLTLSSRAADVLNGARNNLELVDFSVVLANLEESLILYGNNVINFDVDNVKEATVFLLAGASYQMMRK